MEKISKILKYEQKIDYMKDYNKIYNIFSYKFNKECKINNTNKYKKVFKYLYKCFISIF